MPKIKNTSDCPGCDKRNARRTMKRHLFFLLMTALLLPLGAAFTGCKHNAVARGVMNTADSLMETQPDSALSLLYAIDKAALGNDEEKARYALLMSMALDKNYIDTTTFDILQPAINYYLKKGSPDDKLRTYYYQGRIFQNNGDRDNALNSFVKGIDIAPACSDSLVIARTYVALSCIYFELYDFERHTDNNLKAANIYRQLSYKDYELDCLLRALDGFMILKDKVLADSIVGLCKELGSLDDRQNQILKRSMLLYTTEFGSKQDLQELVDSQDGFSGLDTNSMLQLAFAYNKLGDNDRAKLILDYVYESGMGFDTLKYMATCVSVYEDMGNYKEALSMYKRVIHKDDSIKMLIYDYKINSVDERHKIELKAHKDAMHKSRVIWGCIGGIAVLAMGVFILLLLVRSNKAKKELALQRVKAKDAENAMLKSDREKLALEAENLAHRVETLENESESLKSLMEAKEELPPEVRNAIQIRIEMLNSLLASYITANDQYEKPYDAWVKQLTDDTEAFMDSNRLAFQASHPRFIQYFEDHGLSISEINYVCLYAIGLRGKEVGNYMKKRSHVNTSSAIRKKLGIDKHETNIGIYVRKLLKTL